jgi:hypothetical protein
MLEEFQEILLTNTFIALIKEESIYIAVIVDL